MDSSPQEPSQQVQFLTESQPQQSITPEIQPQSQNDLAQLSESDFSQKLEKKKKKKKNKPSSKANQIEKHNEKNNKQKAHEQHIQKMTLKMREAAKQCQSLNKYFPSLTLKKNHESDSLPRIPALYELTSQEAEQISRMLPQGYSLQDKDSQIDTPIVSKISLNQRNLNNFVKKKTPSKHQYSVLKEQQLARTYSRSYHDLTSILEAFQQCPSIDEFFKLEFQSLTRQQIFRRKYYEYPTIIGDHIHLNSIKSRMKTQKIKNFIEFNEEFQQMITNSLFIHSHLRDMRMLECTKQLEKRYCKEIVQKLFPFVNDQDEEFYKAFAMKKHPKSKRVTQTKQQDNQSNNNDHIEQECLDLDDDSNIHRIKVMNHFVRKISTQNPQRMPKIEKIVKNIISRFENDRVKLIRKIEKQEFYEIQVSFISYDLFMQLKTFLTRQISEIKRQKNKGSREQQILRNTLFPHQDSSSFDLDSNSFDT